MTAVPGLCQLQQETFGQYVQSLPVAPSVGSTDRFYILQNGTSKQILGQSAAPITGIIGPGQVFGNYGASSGLGGSVNWMSSGVACPTSGITSYQMFANTALSPTGTTLNFWDGTQCVPWATLNETSHMVTYERLGLPSTWPLTTYQIATLNGALSVIDPFGQGAISAASRTSDWTNAIVMNTITDTILNANDRTTSGPTGSWGIYLQSNKTAGAFASMMQFGSEHSFQNLGSSVVSDPFNINPSGLTTTLRLDSGIGPSTGNPVSTAVDIIPNGNTFNTGINFGNGSLVSPFKAISMPNGYRLGWYSAASTLGVAVLGDTSGLRVTSPYATIAQFITNGGVPASVNFINNTAGQGNSFAFYDGVSFQWSMGYNSSDFYLFDGAGSVNTIAAVPNGNLTFSPAGGTTAITGAATVSGNAKAASLTSIAHLFSAIGTCGAVPEGTLTAVTDSTTNTWGATITGSGGNHVLAYCDGTNWTVAAK